jgi:hypothetical protein
LLLEILENFCIFLNAFESLVNELPEAEKSTKEFDKFLSVGEKIKLEGTFVLVGEFFFW